MSSLRDKDLLAMKDLSKAEILFILETADSFAEVGARDIKKVPSLRGKTVLNFFFESSTRTRTSFELAGKRLSADVVNLSASASSLAKGESLIDTAKSLEAMAPDVVVVRHSESGAPALFAKHTRASVVNAGDGCHEHPTQALLDLYTLRKHVKGFSGLQVAIVGDIAHSRVARSNIYGLKTLGAKVTVIGPKSLLPSQVQKFGVDVSHDLCDGIRGKDVIMMLRIQQERLKLSPFPTLREYARGYGLNRRLLQEVAPTALIMHPGPINRGVEIAADVADGPHSLITEQVESGVAVRMAVLYLLGTRRPE